MKTRGKLLPILLLLLGGAPFLYSCDGMREEGGGSGESGPVAELTAEPLAGEAPLAVEFAVSGSDPDGGRTTCRLDFGDGSASSSICEGRIEHTYFNSGEFAAVLTVASEVGEQALAEASITVRAAEENGPLFVYAAGDIADSDSDNKNDEATARLIEDTGRDRGGSWYALALGDLAYDRGYYRELKEYYDPSWGAFKGKTYAVPGNHEYLSGGDGFFEYWEEVEKGRTNPSDGWYAVDLGSWRLYALNSNVDISASSEQYGWLQAELEDSPRDCILVISHHPRYSPGSHGDNQEMDDVWDLLSAHGGDVMLSGHDHVYARYYPLSENDEVVASGMVQFVIGTGGIHLYEASADSRAAYVQDSEYGVLELGLEEGAYTWRFLSVSGRVLDEGRASCR